MNESQKDDKTSQQKTNYDRIIIRNNTTSKSAMAFTMTMKFHVPTELIVAMQTMSLKVALSKPSFSRSTPAEFLKNPAPSPNPSNSSGSTTYSERPFSSDDEEKEIDEPLSESETPMNDSCDDGEGLDIQRLMLKLYLVAAAKGHRPMPQWGGMVPALRDYWGLERFTLEYCQKYKSVLFWNAVALEGKRLSTEEN